MRLSHILFLVFLGLVVALNTVDIPNNDISDISPTTYRLFRYDDDDDAFDGPDENPDEKEGDEEKSRKGETDGKVSVASFEFQGKVKEYVYLNKEKNPAATDETLLVLTDHNQCYVTHDQGYTWERVAPDNEILAIYVNPYNNDHVYLVAANQKIIYSVDRADNWKSFRSPLVEVEGRPPLIFHPRRPEYLIFLGQHGCDAHGSITCRTVALYSRSFGKRWKEFMDSVDTCSFIVRLKQRTINSLVLCERPALESNGYKSELVWSEDWFKTEQSALSNIIGYSENDPYFVSAVERHNLLDAYISHNGKDWHVAEFPHGFRATKDQAYTVLSSSENSVWIHITTNSRSGTEFGTIVKSNSNGTYYSQLLDNVNRNSNGFVDFEKLIDLEGIAIVNIVKNHHDARKGNKKKLQSMITYNDGAHWSYLVPPAVDSEGKTYECYGKPLAQCSLNLHGYTEREDSRDTFSSQGSVGLMIGVGNVGETLKPFYDGDTFLTRDGGMTWREIKKGVYQWEYGDHGTIIMLVNMKDQTDSFYYSVDEGSTWEEFKFTDKKVTVEDISTVPSDNSKKFLLFTKLPMHRGERTEVFQVDFSHLYNRKCRLDVANIYDEDDDFDIWTPQHPYQSDNCLFGRETKYLRRIPGRDCFLGEKLPAIFKVERNCGCTRQDFECDFNYMKDENGECKLISGYTPPDHEKSQCLLSDGKSNGAVEYWIPTGYRKLPISSCEGGLQLDKSDSRPCPGLEDDYRVLHPLNVVKIVVLILGIASILFAVYWLALRKSPFIRNFFGLKSIRLSEGEEFELPFDSQSALARVKSATTAGFIVISSVTHTAFDKLKGLKNDIMVRIRGSNFEVATNDTESQRIFERLESEEFEGDHNLNETDAESIMDYHDDSALEDNEDEPSTPLI